MDIIYQMSGLSMLCSVRSYLGTQQTTSLKLLCQLPGFLLGSAKRRCRREIRRNEEERDSFHIVLWSKSSQWLQLSSFFLHLPRCLIMPLQRLYGTYIFRDVITSSNGTPAWAPKFMDPDHLFSRFPSQGALVSVSNFSLWNILSISFFILYSSLKLV